MRPATVVEPPRSPLLSSPLLSSPLLTSPLLSAHSCQATPVSPLLSADSCQGTAGEPLLRGHVGGEMRSACRPTCELCSSASSCSMACWYSRSAVRRSSICGHAHHTHHMCQDQKVISGGHAPSGTAHAQEAHPGLNVCVCVCACACVVCVRACAYACACGFSAYSLWAQAPESAP